MEVDDKGKLLSWRGYLFCLSLYWVDERERECCFEGCCFFKGDDCFFKDLVNGVLGLLMVSDELRGRDNWRSIVKLERNYGSVMWDNEIL